jgi:hypothetical protein
MSKLAAAERFQKIESRSLHFQEAPHNPIPNGKPHRYVTDSESNYELYSRTDCKSTAE